MPSLYTREELMNMSPEERDVLKKQLEDRLAQNRSMLPRQNPLAGIGRLIAMTGQAYTTGKVPSEAFDNTPVSTEPDWYTKQAVEQQNAREMEKYKAGLKPSQSKLMKIGESIVQVNPESGESEVLYEPPTKETPAVQKQRLKDTNDLLATVKSNEYMNQRINDAISSAEKLPYGLSGKIQMGYMRNFDARNPLLADWQKVKSMLTDSQLLYTAKTKGAISDREMDLFREAAANDDMGALPMIKTVLDNMRIKLRAEEQGKREAYMRNYGVPAEDVLNEGKYDTIPKTDYKSKYGLD